MIKKMPASISCSFFWVRLTLKRWYFGVTNLKDLALAYKQNMQYGNSLYNYYHFSYIISYIIITSFQIHHIMMNLMSYMCRCLSIHQQFRKQCIASECIVCCGVGWKGWEVSLKYRCMDFISVFLRGKVEAKAFSYSALFQKLLCFTFRFQV